MLAFSWMSVSNGYIAGGIDDSRQVIKSENTSYGDVETKSSVLYYDSDNLSDPYYTVTEKGAPLLTEPTSFMQDASVTKKYLSLMYLMMS